MNVTTNAPATCQTFFGFQLETLIGDGWLPANIGQELGEDAIRNHYQNIRGRGYFLVENWLLAMLDTFRASTVAAAAIVKTETTDAALTEEEKTAAAAVIAYAKADPLNLQIIKYIVNGINLKDVYQAEQCGINTRTAHARIFHLREAAKPKEGQSLGDRLIRILDVKVVSYGGHGKIK